MRGDARKRQLREQPFSRLFPNLITIAGLCCGLSAIRFALSERWELSVAFIFAAAIIDGMDGRIARMLGTTSIFGAQLDSLADFLSFGVAPAMVLYLWGLHDIRGLGWGTVLFFSVCCALRLARFNTGIMQEKPATWQKQFFVGVPSPAGGILCLLPVIIYLQMGENFRIPHIFIAAYAWLIAILMASRIPTFAAKDLRIKPEMILPVTVAGALIVVGFIIEPWNTVCVLSGAYLASIPFSMYRWRKLSRAS